MGQTKSETAIFELSADAKTSELPVSDYSHEMSAKERKEMEGESRRRQELAGSDFVHELEPCGDLSAQ